MNKDKEVLLIENDRMVRNVWEKYLTRWGYRFDMAETGEDGLHLTRKNQYRVILTDLILPYRAGQGLIHTLKQEQPELEIIVVTGQATVEVAVEIMKAGAYGFITKPINFIHAEMLLKNCMEQMKAREESRRLRQRADNLESLNELKEKFIAITSHELRTPVGVLHNVVEILAEDIPSGELGKLISMLSRCTSQLVEIVGKMHEVTQAKSDKMTLDPSSFSLLALCQEVMEEFFLYLNKRGHRFNLDVPVDLVIVADRAKFRCVIRELVQNAIRFTPDEGFISVHAVMTSDGNMVMTISDSGIGIAHQHHERIFELFYEIGGHTNHQSPPESFLGSGMGVGLSIVNDIVAAHDGFVRLESELGNGSSFTVSLPQEVPPCLDSGLPQTYSRNVHGSRGGQTSLSQD